MSIATSVNQIEYPESDGKPMGETPLHRKWMVRICDILDHRYRDQPVYVGSDMLVYYEEGNPLRFVVPDEFVMLNCHAADRRVIKVWEEDRSPDVVIEVTSRSTLRKDLGTKKDTYQQIGVREYFLYDPSGVEMAPPLRGFRLVDGKFAPLPLHGGVVRCETLGIDLHVDEVGWLVLTDTQTHAVLLTEAEAERKAKEAEQAAKEAERRAREAADARNRELEAQIRRLREQLGDE